MRWYYYWQATVVLFLGITYLRILKSGALAAPKSVFNAESSSAFDSGNPQIEFMNNKIKIRKEDPCRQRDLLFLKSWTGALLGLVSVMSTLFSCFKLLPAVYASSCHQKRTWSVSYYPGVQLATIESLTSITCLSLLLVAACLTVLLDYMPKFFLKRIPEAYRRIRRRCA